MFSFKGKHVVIIIEGFPVPLFKILMQHALSLKKKGALVSIISPKMFGLNKSFEIIDDIQIFRHPMPLEAKHVAGFFIEYSCAIFWQFFLLTKIFIQNKIDVIIGCTPPDLVFIPALPFKMLGSRFIYNQFDLNPELFVSKYGNYGMFYKALILMERLTYYLADHTLVPNETFKKIAINRGKVDPEKVTVVRCAPDLNEIRKVDGKTAYKAGKRFLIGYLGVICKQDSLDVLIEVINIISRKRDDVHFAVVGDGPDLPRVKQIAKDLNLESYITFYGMIGDSSTICEIISTCDVCVNPDVADPFNDKITSIKIMEYMALGKPIVQFNLTEGRITAQDASLYAENGNVNNFAEKVIQLLDNDYQRIEMGNYGYKRVVEHLSWAHEEQKFYSAFESVFFKKGILKETLG